ncbi:AraC family transcriptional regulator [Gordonia rhizosphera]|uniref:Putative AraC family transcriptional regulator n=2 Tax=Gordonia rhizosphera TaxID=83341 RepID=K6W8J6_9ACTN|nr:putative AraC family transcriptional regulator [Gordonia rhizosphera NBRC 16068]
MVHWDLPRAPTSALMMTQVGAEHGVPVEVCLRGTRLRPDDLDDPQREISAQQELAVVVNLLGALGNPPGLGLDAGVHYHLTTYGIWGFALISSPTLRSALDLGLRFVDLTFSLGRIRGREEADEMQLVLDAPDVPLTVRRFLIERDAAAIQTLQSELFATPIPVHRISFAFPPPAGGNGRAAEIFGVVPTFDAAENIIAFDPELLDAPLPQASEHTATVAADQCRDLLARRQARTGLAGQVRDTLVARLADPPGADQVAARLNISGRTLRHRLAAEGTSFRALLDEAREHMAEELLVNAGLTVAETAQRLGYVEVSSFSQAFRRWKGVGPRAYRAGHGG